MALVLESPSTSGPAASLPLVQPHPGALGPEHLELLGGHLELQAPKFCSPLNQSLPGSDQGRCTVDSTPAILNPCLTQARFQKRVRGSRCPEQKMPDALSIAPPRGVCPQQGSKPRGEKKSFLSPERVRKPNLLDPYRNTHTVYCHLPLPPTPSLPEAPCLPGRKATLYTEPLNPSAFHQVPRSAFRRQPKEAEPLQTG